MKLITKEFVEVKYIAKNLKEYLRYIDLPQKDLARTFKISQQYMNDIVHGRRFLPEKIKQFLESCNN